MAFIVEMLVYYYMFILVSKYSMSFLENKLKIKMFVWKKMINNFAKSIFSKKKSKMNILYSE